MFLRLGFDGYRRVRAACRDVATSLAKRVAGLGPFCLLTDGSQLPVFDVSAALRESGWLVPAHTFPANRTVLSALRIEVRNGFTHDLADLLCSDLQRALPRLDELQAPQHGADTALVARGQSASAPKLRSARARSPRRPARCGSGVPVVGLATAAHQQRASGQQCHQQDQRRHRPDRGEPVDQGVLHRPCRVDNGVGRVGAAEEQP